MVGSSKTILRLRPPEKIARAQGAVAGLIGFEFAPSYQDHDADDFAQVLEAAKLPQGERTRILEAIQSDRRHGIEELQRFQEEAIAVPRE